MFDKQMFVGGMETGTGILTNRLCWIPLHPAPLGNLYLEHVLYLNAFRQLEGRSKFLSILGFDCFQLYHNMHPQWHILGRSALGPYTRERDKPSLSEAASQGGNCTQPRTCAQMDKGISHTKLVKDVDYSTSISFSPPSWTQWVFKVSH